MLFFSFDFSSCFALRTALVFTGAGGGGGGDDSNGEVRWMDAGVMDAAGAMAGLAAGDVDDVEAERMARPGNGNINNGCDIGGATGNTAGDATDVER